MAVTARIYGLWLRDVLNGAVVTDWDTDTFNVTLHTLTYAPLQDTHDRYDDLTNELPTAGGYTAGGVALGNKTITYTAGTNVLMLDADDAVWAASSITARTAVVRKATGVAANDPLLCYQQSDADIQSTSGNFTVEWNANGIITWTVT